MNTAKGPHPNPPPPRVIVGQTSVPVASSLSPTPFCSLRNETQICNELRTSQHTCSNGIFANSNSLIIEPCYRHIAEKVFNAFVLQKEDDIRNLISLHPENACLNIVNILKANIANNKTRIVAYNTIPRYFSNLIFKLISTTKLHEYMHIGDVNELISLQKESDFIENIDNIVESIIRVVPHSYLYNEDKYYYLTVPVISSPKCATLLIDKLYDHDLYMAVGDYITGLFKRNPVMFMSDKITLRVSHQNKDKLPEEITILKLNCVYIFEKYNISSLLREKYMEIPYDKHIYARFFQGLDYLTDDFIIWLLKHEKFNKDNIVLKLSIPFLNVNHFKRLLSLKDKDGYVLSLFDDNNIYYKIALNTNKDIAKLMRERPEIRALLIDN